VAATTGAQQAAEANPTLHLIDQTTPHTEGRFWKVYEVAGTALVEPLANDPVVVRGLGNKQGWERAAFPWFERGGPRDVPVAVSGPASWPHVANAGTNLPTQPAQPSGQPPATVSDVRMGDDSVRFHVDQVGVPVLVRVSYFPNWQARGAKGPYRVTPNFMVVIPTARDVSLHYGRAGVEWAGWLVSLLGLAGLVALARAKPIEMPEPAVVEERPRAAVRRPGGGPATKRKPTRRKPAKTRR
jgi:hypothetical protein